MFLAEFDPKEAGEGVASDMILLLEFSITQDLIKREGTLAAQSDRGEFFREINFDDSLITQLFDVIDPIDGSCDEVVSVVGETIEKDAVPSFFVGTV